MIMQKSYVVSTIDIPLARLVFVSSSSGPIPAVVEAKKRKDEERRKEEKRGEECLTILTHVEVMDRT